MHRYQNVQSFGYFGANYSDDSISLIPDGLADFADQLNASMSYTDHQLIVLGNGFDLACDLKSGFSDFFTPRVDAIDKLGQPEEHVPGAWVAALRDRGITAWDLILRERRSIADLGADVKWCNVEAVIFDVVGMRGDPDEDNWHVDEGEGLSAEERVTVGTIWEYFHFMRKNPRADWPSVFVERGVEVGKADDGDEYEVYHTDPGLFMPNIPSQRVGACLRAAFPDVASWDYADIRNALFAELLDLEKQFDRYFQAEVERAADYAEKSARLLDGIISADYKELVHDASEVTVLDFNYTHPGIPARYREDLAGVVNVHGSLGDELIFGADGTRCMSDLGVARFSKTYRLMRREDFRLTTEIAYPPGRRIAGTETTAIKFYGHSLARADYAYFQSIFDIVDLYAGDTRLYFFYSAYKPGVREEQLANIMGLLDAYGATMDNRDHGRNLIHKLMLEGRLVIKEI